MLCSNGCYDCLGSAVKNRAVRTDKNDLLFKINMAGGHGGSSGRYDRLHEAAFDYAFVLKELGIKQ